MPSKSKTSKTPKEVKAKATSSSKVAPKASPARLAAPQETNTKNKGKAKAKAVEPELEVEDEEDEEWEDDEVAASSGVEGASDSEDEDEDDDGIDEEGMARLMKALGDDLDDVAQAQISSLNGADEDEDDEEDSEEEGSDEEAEEDDDEKAEAPQASESEAEGDEEEEQIPVDEVDEVDDDAIFTRKVEIDNAVALERIRDTIALDPSMPWTETLVVTYPEAIDVDVDDDLNREVAFYKQALHCANEARKLAAKHKFPFTRPADYFAEMVKSDSHMERIRQRLLNETAAIKQSEDKRKQREGKKFGKQVQIEKLKEREKSKKEMEEKIKGLKRKRKDMLAGDEEGGANVVDDGFDVQVENAIADKPSRPTKKPRMSRDSRDNKYGFGGGANRRSKQNTRESTDSFGPGGGKGKGGKGGRDAKGGKGGRDAKGAKGKPQRPGKSRRMNGRK